MARKPCSRPSGELASILRRVSRPLYVYQEVIDSAPISATEYVAMGDVTELRYGSDLSRVFRSGKLAWLDRFGEPWGYLPSHAAIAFIDNHEVGGEMFLAQFQELLGLFMRMHQNRWRQRHVVHVHPAQDSQVAHRPNAHAELREFEGVYAFLVEQATDDGADHRGHHQWQNHLVFERDFIHEKNAGERCV